MSTLTDLAKIVNPDDPSLTGVLPTAGIIAGGVLNDKAVGSATNATLAGNQQAQGTIATAGNTLTDLTKGYTPYTEAGATAVGDLSKGLQPGGGLTDPFSYTQKDFENDPAYQFDLQQGNKNAYAQAAARGLSLSGGAIRDISDYTTGLADKYFGQDYARAENTFRANQATRLNALQDLTKTGLSATTSQEAAGRQGTEWTATQIADLQNQAGEAQAAGDVGKANALNDLISKVTGQLGENKLLSTLKDINPATSAPVQGPPVPPIGGAADAGTVTASSSVPELATGATGASGATLAGITSAIPGTAAGLAVPEAAAIPGLSSMAGTAAGLPELAGAAPEALAPAAAPEAGVGAFGSIGSAIQSAASGAVNGLQAVGSFMLSNPITIVAGVGLIAATAILKSQAHWEANTLVKDVQEPFGKNLGNIVNNFDQQLAAGTLDRQTAQQLRDSTAATIDQFNNAVYQFAQKGSDNKTAALNAMRTMAENFGARSDYPNLPSYSLILDKMDSEIAALPEAA